MGERGNKQGTRHTCRHIGPPVDIALCGDDLLERLVSPQPVAWVLERLGGVELPAAGRAHIVKVRLRGQDGMAGKQMMTTQVPGVPATTTKDALVPGSAQGKC